MSFTAIGSLAVRASVRDTVRGVQERSLGVDVVGNEVLLNVPSAEIVFRLDVTNARRLYDFLGQAVPLALKDTP